MADTSLVVYVLIYLLIQRITALETIGSELLHWGCESVFETEKLEFFNHVFSSYGHLKLSYVCHIVYTV